MMNQFRSDFYRVSRGAAARNTIIGLLILVVFLTITMYMVTADGFFLDSGNAGAAILDNEALTQAMSEAELAEMRESVDEINNLAPRNALDFTLELLTDNVLAFFMLPFIVAIFCADFSSNAYRNTLSYETARHKVYLAKLLLSVVSYLALVVIAIVSSMVAGGVAFGFQGITGAGLTRLIVFCLLMIPVQLGVIGFAHCVVAFTRKSGSTIAIFLVGLTMISVLIQSLSTMHPAFEWLALIDWNNAGRILMDYAAQPPMTILAVTMSGLVIAGGATALGLYRYRTADML